MQEMENPTLEQMRAFLTENAEIRFAGEGRKEIYAWADQLLRQQDYTQLARVSKGVVRRYVAKMTGLSRAQTTRLIGGFKATGAVKLTASRRRKFPRRYTAADVTLLVKVDEAHGTLSGPATRAILEREFNVFGKQAYQRVAKISGGHLYNLRNSRSYRRQRIEYDETRPTPVTIGERRKPKPEGKPGYVRVDMVHQGDQDGVKGVYHLNIVDEVTQWQVVSAVEKISEAWLKPTLAAALEQFPFQLKGFHSDNGSEFINHQVAAMLQKLLIEQTKSRPRHSNDNGLVEAKNGAVVRKHMGYLHIESQQAAPIQRFYAEHLNPYLNFHRPCGQAEIQSDARGKQKRVYRRYETPWEVFRHLPCAATYLRPGRTMEGLLRESLRETDTECATRMQAAKHKLFSSFHQEAKSA
jgi:transposase InsO family protein